MASIPGPSAPRHGSPFRRPNKFSARPPGAHPAVSDPYYGHEDTAKLCARFVTHLFACPDLPPLSTSVPPAPSPPLGNFIAYALHRTRLHTSVTFAALYLLQRLKARFPAARGSSGHRLFISAFMIASKVICDDTYSNKSWSIVGQGMFALREINQMEREMCSYLEWQLNIDPSALKEFEHKVRRDFKGSGPYPTYVLSSPAPSPVPSTTPYTAANAAAPPPVFTTNPTQGPSTSPPKPLPPPVPVHAGNPYGPSGSHHSHSQSHAQRPSPASASSSASNFHPYSHPQPQPHPPSHPHPHPQAGASAPNTPDTPESSMSTSTSPASSAPPSTPLGYEDHSVRVVGAGPIGTPSTFAAASPGASASAAAAGMSMHSMSMGMGMGAGAPPPGAAAYVRSAPAPAVLKRAKGGDIFARPAPCVW